MVYFFTTEAGDYVYVGEDKFENDKFFGATCPGDVWFHVDDLSSAHIYLRVGGIYGTGVESLDDIPPTTLAECAQLTKANSIQGSKQPTVDINYTKVENLKKTPAMAPGLVTFHDHKAVRLIKNVARDAAMAKRIEKTRQQRDMSELHATKEKREKEQREADRLRKQREKDQALSWKAEKEARSYDNLFKAENMSTNQKPPDDDDFIHNYSMFISLGDIPYRFYVFSEELGNHEGREAEKILYGYPSNRSLDDQLKDVGLSEAFFRFYNTFAANGKYRVLKTVDGRMALYSPEPSIWLLLTLKFPSARGNGAGALNSLSPVNNPSFIADNVLSTILQTYYNIWRLHNDSISTIINKQGPNDCKNQLKSFFDHFLVEAQPFQWSLLDTFSGVSFLPLERVSYLKIHSFLNRLECTFSQVAGSIFFFSNFLTWSGLNQEDTRLLYFYASHFMAPSSDDSADKLRSYSTGRFVQPRFGDGGPQHVVLKCYLSSFHEQKKQVCLLVYKMLSAMVFIVVPNEEDVTEEFVHDLSDFYSDHLLVLASDLGKAVAPVTSPHSKDETQFKFIYYNTSNAALKSTIHDEKTRQIDRGLVIPEAVTRMMMLADYLGPVQPVEVSTSVSTDSWVVVKKTAQRQLFLVVTRPRGTCTLIHVADEIRKMSGSTFSDILFLEI